MARCTKCNRWRFSFALHSGLCANCFSESAHTLPVVTDMPVATNPPPTSVPDSPTQTNVSSVEKAQNTTPKSKVKQPKKYRVTGMSNYEENLLSLAVEDSDYLLTKKELIDNGLTGQRIWKYYFGVVKVDLVPEPDNPHDPNAIKVLVDGQHVGYIKAGSCAHLLKVIQGDRIKSIQCEISGGPYKFIEEDYDYDRNKEVYSLDKGTAPYSVHLTIDEA